MFVAKGILKDNLQNSGLRLLAFAKALDNIDLSGGGVAKKEHEVEDLMKMVNGESQEEGE